MTKKATKQTSTNTITNCSFVGVQWDAKAVEAINKIADGLHTNAKALADLAHVLKASNVTLESMVKVGM